MAIPKTTIKTPAGDVIPSKGPNAASPGKFNGEPGYKGRTASPNAVREKTYDAQRPIGGLDIKTPGSSVKK